MKKYIVFLFTLTSFLGFTACSDEGPSGTSIFDTSAVNRNGFDQWLLKNYAVPYNIDFKYKMEDIESDMKYTLIPADSSKSAKLAIIVKYLWLDAYDEVAGLNFTKSNVPRMIHLIGSPAYNNNNTVVLGTAEGGLKVTLYMVNYLDDAMLHDYATLNLYYFHTMHHEFTHILNQKKPYNTAFNLITEDAYVSGDWYQVETSTAHQAGFVTPYAMSEGLEDFAEMLSVYVTTSQTDWDALLVDAGTTGSPLILQKLDYVRNYMQESWGIDIDQLRDVVLRRAGELYTLDLEHLK
jgi:substrate import-associated zinc metallohydrolase lipoprotein